VTVVGGRPLVATRPAPSTYADTGVWPDVTLGSHLDDAAGDTASGLAVVDGATRLDYGELRARVGAVAAALADAGVQRGDVVTVELPNWWEALVAMHAILRIGAVVNPVVPIYRDREVGFILHQARPRVVIVPHRFRGFDYVEMLQRLSPEATTLVVVRPEGPLPEGFSSFDEYVRHPGTVADSARPDDICLLLYTSGTTADPKGVLHNHRTLGYENGSIVNLFGLGAGDTVFMPSPVTHITGFLYGLLMPPMLRVPSVLLDVWDPEVAAGLVEQETCRLSVGATPFLQGLTDAYSSPSSLRTFLCGGADVPPELVRRARSVLGATVVRVYGSSEFPTFSCGGPTDDLSIAAETDGLPIGPVEGRLGDVDGAGVGELVVRGPDLFLGYLDGSLNEDAFTTDGYFRTGDLATLGPRGAVTIMGRKKDVIIRNGENISAKEIEDLLYEHPAVREVAVVAMPDPVVGERACAFIVPVADTEPTLAELCRFLDEQRIARQKLPERMIVLDELPKTASGKVQKFVLRDRARQQP
jgi:cyclohexanecarboxylate-CoA ligase